MKKDKLSKILEEMNKVATDFRGTKYLRPEEAVTAILKFSPLKHGQKDKGIEICGFGRAWQSKCPVAKPCVQHDNLKCSQCGKPAIKECSHAGSLVCGAPLCETCKCSRH